MPSLRTDQSSQTLEKWEDKHVRLLIECYMKCKDQLGEPQQSRKKLFDKTAEEFNRTQFKSLRIKQDVAPKSNKSSDSSTSSFKISDSSESSPKSTTLKSSILVLQTAQENGQKVSSIGICSSIFQQLVPSSLTGQFCTMESTPKVWYILKLQFAEFHSYSITLQKYNYKIYSLICTRRNMLPLQTIFFNKNSPVRQPYSQALVPFASELSF